MFSFYQQAFCGGRNRTLFEDNFVDPIIPAIPLIAVRCQPCWGRIVFIVGNWFHIICLIPFRCFNFLHIVSFCHFFNFYFYCFVYIFFRYFFVVFCFCFLFWFPFSCQNIPMTSCYLSIFNVEYYFLWFRLSFFFLINFSFEILPVFFLFISFIFPYLLILIYIFFVFSVLHVVEVQVDRAVQTFFFTQTNWAQ